MNTIDLNAHVYEILKDHPELKELLIDLGFKPLANPLLAASLTKHISLNKACSLANVSKDRLIKTLKANGYQVIGEINHE
ncbi:TPA: DUF1858 domain-containing protein [Streptococcus suis]